MDQEKIGIFIAELRKKYKYSQEKLAEMIPVSRQAISKWELGKSVPDSSTLIKLSEIFGVTINEILAGERLKEKDMNNILLDIYDDRNDKKLIVKRLLVIIVLLLIIFLIYYFINTYNSIKVYTVNLDTEDIKITDGILVTTKKNIYFKLGNIIKDNNLKIKYLELYYLDINKNKNIIFSCKDCNLEDVLLVDFYGYNSYFDYENIDYIIKNMNLKIKLENDQEKIFNLNLKQDFANNFLLFKKEKKVITSQENKRYDLNLEKNLIIELIKAKFKKTDDGYSYATKKLNANYLDNFLVLEYINDNIKKWTYDFENNILMYEEFDINNNLKVNYIYSISLERCLTDNCENINVSKNEFINYINYILK